MSGGFNLQDGSPLVYLSGENDRMGLISNINLSACRIFGFLRKEELLGKNVKVLMPQIYSKNHDEFIRNAILKSAEQISNKERSVYGRHTSGYIFPISLQIKFFQSFLHGKQFAATLKSEKKGINSSVAYLLIDEQGLILEASSSAVNLLDIDKYSHQNQKKKIQYDLSILIPDMLNYDIKSRCLGK
jgi:PAS domain S-box-containing protein